MGIVLGAWPLTYVGLALVGGAITDSWGIRRSLLLGMCFVGLSEVLRYFATGFGTMFLFVALFGLGGPMVSIGSPKTIATWFRGKERGMAVGIYTTGVWIGGAVAVSTMNNLDPPAGDPEYGPMAAAGVIAAQAAATIYLYAIKQEAPGEVG